MNKTMERAWNSNNGVIKLFISQPFTGCDDAEIRAQRKELHELFAQFGGVSKDDIILLDQYDPKDPYDDERNFENEMNRDAYRFCRSIGILASADAVLFYGNWKESRGCKLEREICERYKIPIYEQEELKSWVQGSNIHNKMDILNKLWK